MKKIDLFFHAKILDIVKGKRDIQLPFHASIWEE